WYKRTFDAFVERARGKVHEKVEAWGWLGIAAFVAIPLPVTGAWTGTLGAWILGLDKKKTLLSVIIGVTVAGCIVTAVSILGISAFSIFIKKL
ncbi:MAG TPA: small multi-drug export protein, partial [Treponema sp.]|nr:small multi-drug export protein [Treponema sp.]HRS02783.1 small multi-drug export protein [Treponema sp.]